MVLAIVCIVVRMKLHGAKVHVRGLPSLSLQSVRSSSVCRKMRRFSQEQVRYSASSILYKGSIHAAIGSQTLGIGGDRLVRRYMCAWVVKSVRCSAGFQPSEIVRLSPVMVSSVI